MIRISICVALASCFISQVNIARAGETDWPQWRGPNRDGHAAPQELLESWPEGGPELKWSFKDAGHGYSTVAVVDGRTYTLGSDEEHCFALCISTDGNVEWKTDFSRASVSGDYNQNWGAGPRSTPTIDGAQVFVLSDTGVLAALNKSDGELQWKTDLVADYDGKIPVWGYSESPLVDGDRVVVTPGEENFMVAVDRNTGENVWNSKGVNAPAQYVSILKGTTGTTSFYVTASKSGLYAFDCETGEKLFEDETTGNNVAVVPTPVLFGDQLYHTSDYGAGNTLLKLSSEGQGSLTAEQIYHLNDKTMHNHHGGVVLVEGTIYGMSKTNGGQWMAQDLQTGNTLWQEKIGRNRSGSICYADGHLYCYNDKDGTVFLVEAKPDGWNAKGNLRLPQETKFARNKGAIWAHPVIADQTLIIRDQDLIFAFDLKP